MNRYSYNETKSNSNGSHSLTRRLACWYRNWHGRRLLQQLDASALHDIGVSRADALQEGGKPFWRC
ncbi:DUF1127 domain-containing protein [Marinobacterium arenosum]|uniref:DUF1127 domain-containing protein n=1 Tax=Marinobacterium arenosum TaxID=2862496 RepID=UPI001C95FB3C|nr:DUF1127 domain-containing protein [Marinobacterium arenosum]MBY4675789.1 DUF1127 domain-containing protein [Marinobacterium arenosum]